METNRLVVELPAELKFKLQVIAVRKKVKMGPEVTRLIEVYVKRNEKFLEAIQD